MATPSSHSFKRPAESVAEHTPLPKRSNLVPVSAGGATETRSTRADEVAVLQSNLRAARQRMDEVQEEAQREARQAAQTLLHEKQRREEKELLLDFARKTEARLEAQLKESREQLEEEHEARLSERWQATERLEKMRDELTAEHEQQRADLRQTITQLQAEVASARGSAGAEGAAGGADDSGSGPLTPGPLEEVQRQLKHAVAENEALASRLAAAERRVERRAESESDAALELQATRRELQAAREALRGQSAAKSSVASAAAAVVGDDLHALKRQLAEADEQRASYDALVARHEKLEAQVQGWCMLFATELSAAAACSSFSRSPAAAASPAQTHAKAHGAAATLASASPASLRRILTEEGLPEPGAAEAVKERLAALRAEVSSQLSSLGEVRAQATSSEAAASAAARDAARLREERDAATEAVSAARLEAQRAELRATQAETKVKHAEELNAMLMNDRDKLRTPLKGAKPGDAPGAAGNTPSGGGGAPTAAEVERLGACLAAAESRCASLEELCTQAAAREAAALTAAREARGQAAEAKADVESKVAELRALHLLEGSGGGGRGGVASESLGTSCGKASEAAAEPKTKVLHMTNNPAQNAQLATIDSLRARVRSLQMQLDIASEASSAAAEGGGAQGAMGGPSVGGVAAAASAALEAQSEAEDLRRQLKEATTRKERLMTVFNKQIKEFREVVIQLTGYRVDLEVLKNQVTLYPPYTAHDATLVFETGRGTNGKIQSLSLVETAFYKTPPPAITSHMADGHLSAFLAAITLALKP